MSTELSTQVNRGLSISSFDELSRLAHMAAKTAFVPKDFQGKPESCTLAMMAGIEVGFGPIQSCQSIAVVNGRPTIWGDAALALCMSSPVCEYVREFFEGEGDKLTAVCIAKRKGFPEPHRVTFSVADAKAAKLWGKSGPWVEYSKRMLQMRARGFALRDTFPDVLRGLVTAEEAADYTHVEPAVTQPQATPEPPPKVASVEDMEKARLAIAKAATVEKLKSIALVVHERQDQGFYTSEQAHELLDMLDDRRDLLTTEVEEVPA